jgi:8-oxo-dGTP pyrophosphatase MutT (NUDIX family)
VREAAVLVPIYRGTGGDLMLLVIRRAPGGPHGGQLAFPGGTRSAEDGSLRETALREAVEELGLPEEEIAIVEELPVVETRTTGFRVAPFLAEISGVAAARPNADEVAEILEVAVADLARPDARGSSLERFEGRDVPVEVPYFRVGPHRLWGLSYRILEPLVPRLAARD